MTFTLKIGDRVIYLGEFEPILCERGTVVGVDHNNLDLGISVRFDKKRNFLHDCDGQCEDCHGYYVGALELGKIISREEIQTDTEYMEAFE